MATLRERIIQQVEKAKRAQAVKGSISKVAAGITDTAKLAAEIRKRQAGGSTTK